MTTVPATLMGVSDRVGTIAKGRDADLVLWNGTPFEFTTRPVGVVLEGATLDFKDGLESGFSINNPNAQKTCGCGSSFS